MLTFFRRSIVLVLALGASISGCIDKSDLPTAPLLAINGFSSIVESDGFYRDTADGMYYWDKTWPEGESSIYPYIGAVTSKVQVPRYGTKGWVEATVYYSYADIAKLRLVHDAVRANGTVIYSDYENDSGWRFGSRTVSGQGCQRNCAQNLRHRAPLLVEEQCDVSASVSGQASAAFALPFGISIGVVKPSVKVTIGLTPFRQVNAYVPNTSEPAFPCDMAPTPSELSCDNENTSEIEYCPIDGDPRNVSVQQTGVGAGEIRRIQDPQPGGATREYCEWTTYFISYDGGNTWQYSHREFNGCVDIME